MTVIASVIYPNKEGAKFDLDYYMKTHMPLVSEKWTQYGLTAWHITELKAGPNDAKPEHRIMALLYWDSIDHVKKAMESEEAKAVFGDIPNFTDISPILNVGVEVGSKKH